jgi:regulatory protein
VHVLNDRGRAQKTKAHRAPSLRATAVRMLARREYSRGELRQRRIMRGAAPQDADAALDELERLGYLSDARYAQAIVTQKSGRFSRRAIAGALQTQGVAPAAVDEALDAHAFDDDATLVALWRRRFGVAPTNDREKARQVRFLQSHGFALSAILKLLRAPPGDADPS